MVLNGFSRDDFLRAFDTEFCLKHAQGVDEDEGELHEEIPCGEFGEVDGFPTVLLPGVLPCSGDCAEVFRQIDEEGDEAKAQKEGHFQGEILRGEMDERFPEKEGSNDNERPTEIREVVVGEEVRVGEDGDDTCDPEGWESGEAKMESTPGTCHVGADG